MRLSLLDAWDHAVNLPDRRPIYHWAAENVVLPPVLTQSGAFRIEGSRQMIAPFDAIKADGVREVNLQAHVRGAKSLIPDVATPWAIENDNASILSIFQTDPIAKNHAELRLWPILKRCPGVAAMLPANQYKQRTQEIIFANGLPLFVLGPAIGNLQSRGFKWVICDEPWLYEKGRLGEAKARLGDFRKMSSSKLICLSQGGIPESDWDNQFKSGVLHEWQVECQGCHRFFTPVWSGFHSDGSRHGVCFDAPKMPGGDYDRKAAVKSLRYVCPLCAHPHRDTAATRAAWNATGRYVTADGAIVGPGYVFPEQCSFHWWAIIDYRWADLLNLWLSARKAAHLGDYSAQIQFFQKYLAESKNEATVHEMRQAFARRASTAKDKVSMSFDGATHRFMTADRQQEDVYWAEVRDWAPSGESLRVWFGKCFADAEVRARQIEYAVADDCVAIDSGHRPYGDHGVYAACIKYGWVAARGDKRKSYTHEIPPQFKGDVSTRVQRPFAMPAQAWPGGSVGGADEAFALVVYFSSHVLKDRLQGLIDHGFWKEPDADPNDETEVEYRKQMSAEFKVKDKTGAFVWVCPSGENHAFDLGAMQILCAMSSGLLPADVGDQPEPENKNHAASE